MSHLISHIQRLPSEVVNKIAAGEVIQKPFNAVKELLENALDSGATNISIYLEDGGYTKITIRDNGCGIFPEDANKIATRFHSSKIKSVDEVYNIKTFGFRGEALSSMALIGKLIILSKRKEYELGIQIVIDAKNREVTREADLDNGTSIIVTDIFSDFTVLEVKKSVQHITKLLRDYALVLKDVKLVLNAPESIFRSPVVNPDEVIELKLWMERIIGKNLVEVDFALESLKCQGKCYYSSITEQKPGIRNVSEYVILVNKRLVTIPELINRMNRLMSEYFSRVEHFIFIFEMNPAFIDVHISPTKHLVTLKDGGELIEMVVQTLCERFEDLRQDKVISTMETSGISQKSEVKLNSTISQIAFEENEFTRTFSTPKTQVSIPSQKIRIDHNQSLMENFIQNRTIEIVNDKSQIIESPEIEILSDKSTVLPKKKIVLVPVVVGPSKFGQYKVVGYHEIIGSFESPFSFLKTDRIEIFVHILLKNQTKILTENGTEHVEMVLDAKKLIFPLYVAERKGMDCLLVNNARKVQTIMLNVIQKQSIWVEKLRKAVNLKISKVNQDFALFGQYQTEFFIVPLPDIFQEYIQQSQFYVMVSYTLIAFPFRGLAETIRLIFHYSGTEFVDKRLTPEQWTAMKPLTPYGQLPILEVDGKQLAQSGAIYRFLAKKFGLNGNDDWESAQLDSLILMMDDFRNECREFFAVVTGIQKGDKTTLFTRQFKPASDKYIPALERALHISGSGFFSKKGISYVDFFVAEYVDTLNSFLPEFLVKHPSLLDHSKRVHDLPQIQKYLSTRPKTAV